MVQLVIRTGCIATVGLVLSWLLLAGGSPFADWLAGQPLATNVASAINLPAVLFALTGLPAGGPPSAGVVTLVAALQWLVYGIAIAWLWRLLWPDRLIGTMASRPAAGRKVRRRRAPGEGS